MAKRKTPKSKEIVDLKPQAEKLTQEELTELQTTVGKVDRLHLEIGKVEAQKHNFLHMLAGVQDEIKLLQTKLEDNYGSVDIDVRDGTIKAKENGQADS
jgi:hypothetical protein